MKLPIADIPVPDGLFYYALSTLLAGALFWLIARYVNKLDTVIDLLVKNDAKQDATLDGHDKRIEQLEDFRDAKIVKYSK